MRQGIQKALLVSAAVLFVATSACHRSSSHGLGIVGITTIAGMESDPARDRVYVGDTASGRVVAISAKTGDPVAEIVIGNTIGGLTLDHCFGLLYVAVTGGRRIDVIDCETLARTAVLRLGTPPYAIASTTEGHLLAVTARGLLDLELATLKSTRLLTQVDRKALLAVDRKATRAWLVETLGSEIVVSAFDLANLAAAPVTTAPGLLPGKAVGIEVSFAGDRIYVATDGADGVVELDGMTLQKVTSIDVGPGLASIANATTGTRMHVSHGGALAQGMNLDAVYAKGRDVVAGSNVSERGLHVTPNNLHLMVHGNDGSITSYPLWELEMDVPSALRQGSEYTLTIDGTPNAFWWLFVSLAPGYLYIDDPSLPDPRFFDLSLADGFVALAYGLLDGAGHTQLTGVVPTGFTEAVDVVIQAVELPSPGRAAIEIGNPMVLRFLAPECSD